ncbi:MAG: hypothetical protein AB7E80_00770 [Hyphomicrobiaceae bacterium]
MTAHVAEHGEGRGRVVLAATCASPIARTAIDGAIDLARAFDAEIEALMIEDRQLAEIGAYPFARQIGFSGRISAWPDADVVETGMRLVGKAAARDFERKSRASSIGLVCRFVVETPLRAVQHACQSMGPWNVVALTQSTGAASLASAGRLFDRVTGMTGVLLPAQRPAAPAARIVALVEDEDRIAGMLRTAERLARPLGAEVVLACWAQRSAERKALLSAANKSHKAVSGELVEIARSGAGADAIGEALRRLRPHTVIAVNGGIASPAGEARAPFGDALDASVLLVR